jgi:hypothetical protein
VYVGEVGRQQRPDDIIWLGQPQKSIMAEDRYNTGQNTDFSNISTLDTETGYMDHLIKEVSTLDFKPEKVRGMELPVSVGPSTQ